MIFFTPADTVSLTSTTPYGTTSGGQTDTSTESGTETDTTPPTETSATEANPSDITSNDESTTTTPPETTTTTTPPEDILAVESLNETYILKDKNGVELVKVTINFFKFTNPDNDSGISAINDILVAKVEGCKDYAEQSIKPLAVAALEAGKKSYLPFEAVLGGELMEVTDKSVSLTYTTYEYNGSAEGLETRNALCLDRKNGYPIDLDALFPVFDTVYTSRIFDEIVLLSKEMTNYKFYPDYEKLIRLCELEDRWFCTDDCFVVLYNPYEIASKENGVIQFAIPFEKLSDIIKMGIIK